MLVAAAALALGAGPVRAESGQAGACADGRGVTVIVDAQELSSAGPSTRCAPEAGGHGLEILTKAGVSYETAKRSPGFVCKVAGLPVDEPCQDTSPADAYWSYWLAKRGGTWCLSNKGAQARTPPAGTVEGWSFAKARQDSGPVPPRDDPPAALSGTAPAALAAGDCDSVSKTGTTTSTTRLPASGATGRTVAPPARGAPSTAESTTTVLGTTTTTASGLVAATSTTAVSEAAAGPPVTLDVSPAGSARGGSAGPAIVGAAAVVGLGAAAATIAHRRRRRPGRDLDESLR
jgi:hypothetical protein